MGSKFAQCGVEFSAGVMEGLKRERLVSCVLMILIGYSISLGQESAFDEELRSNEHNRLDRRNADAIVCEWLV